MSYVIGQHGAKRREQHRLTELYGERVNGRTHESEHTIGFSPLNEGSGVKRGGSSIIRKLEKDAWAYQEVKAMHRNHIGTGTKGTADLSGFTSDTYRATQRSLVEHGNISSAVQINQLAYAFLPGFSKHVTASPDKSADNSFGVMVSNMNEVRFAKGRDFETKPVSQEDRVEMYLSRLIARGEGKGPGGWPSAAQINAAKELIDSTPVND